MRDLRIATGKSRLARFLSNSKVTWEQLYSKLTTVTLTAETFLEYMGLDRELQASIKDVGWLIGGTFRGKLRRKADMKLRSLITLDIDHLSSFDDLHDMVLQSMSTLGRFAFCWHTTHKHHPDRPRLRLVIPLSRDIPPERYEPLARVVAKEIGGMDIWDDTTFQVARIMYLPSASKDGVFEAGGEFEGDGLDVDRALSFYNDVDDFLEWPTSSRVGPVTHHVAEARDPLEAPGVIGAFNRVFDIHQAITHFDLHYEPTEWDNRYSISGATGPSGAIVYDDVFMFSHHESDPAFNQNLNAFDLVRVHHYQNYTQAEIENKVPTGQRESMKSMMAEAAAIPEVAAELQANRVDEMEDLGEPDPDKPAPKRLTFEGVLADINNLDPKTWDSCEGMIPFIAAGKFEPTKNEALVKALQRAYVDAVGKGGAPRIADVRDMVDVRARMLTSDLADEEGALSDIELSLTEQFLARHYAHGKHLMRFGKVYWGYVSGVWRILDEEGIEGQLQAEISRLREERPEEVMELVAAVGESKTTSLSGSLVVMLRRQLAMIHVNDPDPLKQREKISLPVINCLNCELHFDAAGKMTVVDHDPAHMLTVQIQATYDPEAKCPEWNRFCQMIFADCMDPEGMQRHLEELGGYIINLSRWLKTWVLFHGNTDTGKSTVLQVLSHLLGQAFLGQPLTAHGKTGSNFSESHLIGRLLLADDDFSKADELPDGLIKKISEEKMMTAELKFGGLVTFLARSLPLICANHRPPTRDVSDAFRERALVIDFLHRIAGAQRSDQRQARMMDETSGILNRFARGLGRLRARGDWDPPVDAIQAHRSWVGASNPLFAFIDECMVMAEGEHVRASAVWTRYKIWVKEAGSSPLGKQELYKRLEQTLGARSARNGYEGWGEWTLKPQVSVEEVENLE